MSYATTSILFNDSLYEQTLWFTESKHLQLIFEYLYDGFELKVSSRLSRAQTNERGSFVWLDRQRTIASNTEILSSASSQQATIRGPTHFTQDRQG